MSPGCRQLFEYAVQFVTTRDIERHCLSDPGYLDYVREWSQILRTKNVPLTVNFDIGEIIATSDPAFPCSGSDPASYWRFCVFVHSVAAAISTGPEGPDEEHTINYIAVHLLYAARQLGDEHLLTLLPAVFAEVHQVISTSDWYDSEAPFFLMGQLILAFLGFNPNADVSGLAAQIIEEARPFPRFLSGGTSPVFLWDCTCYKSHHDRWLRFVELSFPAQPVNETVALLKDALLFAPPRHP